MKASTWGVSMGARKPSPEVMAMTRSSGTAGGRPGSPTVKSRGSWSPEIAAKPRRSASVMVRPGVSNPSPISRSSK